MDISQINAEEIEKVGTYKPFKDANGNINLYRLEEGVNEGSLLWNEVSLDQIVDFSGNFDLLYSLSEEANAENLDLSGLIVKRVKGYSDLIKTAQDRDSELQQAQNKLKDAETQKSGLVEENQELKDEINELSQQLNNVKKDQTQNTTVSDEKKSETSTENISKSDNATSQD